MLWFYNLTTGQGGEGKVKDGTGREGTVAEGNALPFSEILNTPLFATAGRAMFASGGLWVCYVPRQLEIACIDPDEIGFVCKGVVTFSSLFDFVHIQGYH